MNNFRTVIFGFFLLSFHPSLASWQDLPFEIKKQITSSISGAENLLLCGLADKENKKILHELLHDFRVQIKASVIPPDNANIKNMFSDIHVTVNNCTIKTLQWINRFTDIKSLSLAGTKVRDGQLTFILDLKELRELNLSKTALNNQGFVRLENFPKLEILDVSDTEITDNCLERVFNYPEKLPKLKKIDISKTNLSKFDTLSLVKKWTETRPNLKFVHNLS
jgi:Leucine-rich repeat (LRR) protein